MQGRSLEDVYADTLGLLGHLSEDRRRRVVLITTVPSTTLPAQNSIGVSVEDYRNAFRRAAAHCAGVAVVEGEALLKPLPENFIDGVHPNDTGMAVYARNLVEQLRLVTGHGDACK